MAVPANESVAPRNYDAWASNTVLSRVSPCDDDVAAVASILQGSPMPQHWPAALQTLVAEASRGSAPSASGTRSNKPVAFELEGVGPLHDDPTVCCVVKVRGFTYYDRGWVRNDQAEPPSRNTNVLLAIERY